MEADVVFRRVVAAQAGDQVALGRLLLDHDERLARHVASRLPPAAQPLLSVADILQETYAAAFRDLASFEYRGSGSFYAWLRTIADHRLQNALHYLRRKKRGGVRSRIPAEGHDAGTSAYNLFDMLVGDQHTPSMSVARDEAVHAVHVALAALPPDYQDVVRLRYLEHRSVEETAAELGRSPAAIRGVTDRAKKKLRQLIGHLSVYLST